MKPHNCDTFYPRWIDTDKPTMRAVCPECGADVSVADALFAVGHAEWGATEALYQQVGAVFGLTWPDDPPPWSRLSWDYYDTSIEIKGAAPNFVPTAGQWAAIRALGFSRMWVCYEDADGKEIDRLERYYGEGKQRGGPDDGRVAVARAEGNDERYPALRSRLKRAEGYPREAEPVKPAAAAPCPRCAVRNYMRDPDARMEEARRLMGGKT